MPRPLSIGDFVTIAHGTQHHDVGTTFAAHLVTIDADSSAVRVGQRTNP